MPAAWLRRSARVALSICFLISGVAHFLATAAFASIVPDYLVAPDLLVYFSGAAELVFALLLFVPRTRRLAAFGLVLLIVAVWPANWNMALHAERYANIGATWLWLRVALQLPLVLWAAYAGPIWPFANRARAQSEIR